jgi:hypothetical protein
VAGCKYINDKMPAHHKNPEFYNVPREVFDTHVAPLLAPSDRASMRVVSKKYGKDYTSRRQSLRDPYLYNPRTPKDAHILFDSHLVAGQKTIRSYMRPLLAFEVRITNLAMADSAEFAPLIIMYHMGVLSRDGRFILRPSHDDYVHRDADEQDQGIIVAIASMNEDDGAPEITLTTTDALDTPPVRCHIISEIAQAINKYFPKFASTRWRVKHRDSMNWLFYINHLGDPQTAFADCRL